MAFYYCLEHGRVEEGADVCRADNRLGPYPTRQAAENWRDGVERRNEVWDEQDEAWEDDDWGTDDG